MASIPMASKLQLLWKFKTEPLKEKLDMDHRFTKAMAVIAVTAMTLLPASVTLAQQGPPTKTPIKHIVVIFQENVSFDHYFGTYPHTQKNNDSTSYFAGPNPNTPRVNSLEAAGLLDHNPNKANPFRIDRSTPNTCDQDHDYGAEQAAFDGGLMDKFVEITGCVDPVLGPNSVMGYFDGNTVTALWNYAQHFAMNDNFYGTGFGPSTPGVINLISGNTFGATLTRGSAAGNIAGGLSSGAVIGDPRPTGDICVPATKSTITMSGKNVGDLLNTAGVTWGWFQGGFDNCSATHTGITGLTFKDYIPHHEGFQYYPSTANPNHLLPTSVGMIGQTDQANHQYDLTDFWAAVKAHNMPAVTFLKAAGYQDGHAGYSDPLDEQQFIVNTLDALQQTPEWQQTAVIITYDDSDGWYDHQMGPIVNQSNVSDDQLLGASNCGVPKAIDASGAIQNGRCGYGPRLPLLVISLYARKNYVDHLTTDQSSILRFIEDNWSLGRIGNGSTDAIAGTLDGLFDFSGNTQAPQLFLDPVTGQILYNQNSQ
jgi:phospholipase C